MSEPRGTLRIAEMPEDNRPRERMLAEGSAALSDGELLAVLLGSGSKGVNAIELGNRILRDLGGFNGIHRTDLEVLKKFPGVGLAKAARIKAAVELGNRLSREAFNKKNVIRSPEDAVELVAYEMRGKSQEELWVLGLDVRNQLLNRQRLYKGSQDSSTARVSEIFKNAVALGYYGIMLVHNHPSGDPDESPEDVNLTRAVIQAGQLLDIRVLDHIIIGQQSFTSLKRNHPSLWT